MAFSYCNPAGKSVGKGGNAGFQPAPEAGKMPAVRAGEVQTLRSVLYGTGRNACRYLRLGDRRGRVENHPPCSAELVCAWWREAGLS